MTRAKMIYNLERFPITRNGYVDWSADFWRDPYDGVSLGEEEHENAKEISIELLFDNVAEAPPQVREFYKALRLLGAKNDHVKCFADIDDNGYLRIITSARIKRRKGWVMTDSQVEKIRKHDKVRVVVEAEFIGEDFDSSAQVGEPTEYVVHVKGGLCSVSAKDIKEVVPDYRRRCFRKHDIVKIEVRPGIFELDICDGETNDGRVMVRGVPKKEWPHYTRVKLVCAEHLRDDRREVSRG